jgi:AAA15 family ATPase/GTPase
LLEALSEEGKFGVGKTVSGNKEWILELFKPQSARYTNPAPKISTDWFSQYLKYLADNNEIWFSDKKENIIAEIMKSKKNHNVLGRHGEDVFNFGPLIDAFFSKDTNYYKPILIPPKRRIEFKSNIDMTQEITPSGGGLINRLFFLKNQDLESKSYGIYKSIYETFHYITSSKFNVVPNKENRIELFYQTESDWIPADACGLGLTDVLNIVTVLNVLDSKIFFIEEPENHLHADFQKKLLAYLTKLKSKQFLITTHSATFLNTDIIDKIFYCSNNGEINVSDQTSKSEIINSLGYSVTENLVADLIILLEGPSDIPVIKEMLKWVGVLPHHNIKYWPLGGDIMATLDLSVFAERRNVISLIDSDPGSSVQRTRFKRNCKANQIYCKKLNRYSIENYFTIDALRETFPNQIPTKIKEIQPMEPVDSQIGFKGKKKTVKAKNSQIVQNMSLSDIEGIDLKDFLNYAKKILNENGTNRIN